MADNQIEQETEKQSKYSIMAEYLARRYGGIALEIEEALMRGSTRMLDKHFIPTSQYEWIFGQLESWD